jgi:DNA-directed RNA polymerase alpha subunit
MESHENPDSHFLTELSAPARRALENEGLITLQMLAATTKSELLQLHGVGEHAIQTIERAMDKIGMTFKG